MLVVTAALAALVGGVGAQEPDFLIGEPTRVSTMGPDGETSSRANSPDIAYNPVDDEFLVVWFGNDGVLDGGQSHQEVFGQRISAATGEPVGEDDFRISCVGNDREANLFAAVSVTHNPEATAYLVASLASATTSNPPFRVRVQRIDGATGELVGEQKIITDYETLIPSFGLDVVYNTVEDEYLVVWEGTDESPDPPIERFEYELKVNGRRLGRGYYPDALDLGGGLGIPSHPDEPHFDLAGMDAALLDVRSRWPDDRGAYRIWIEPGRYLVGESGVLLTRVTQTKGKGDRRYVGVATGMNALIRPSLYGAHHEIVNLSRIDEPATQVATIVGPICETGDTLGRDRSMPACDEGDVILIASVGAYGRVMSSQYNLRPTPVEIVL